MSSPRRILLVGPLGPPHIEDQALALAGLGHEVHVGGNAPPELDDDVLESAGIPVSRAPGLSRSTPWGIAATTVWLRRLVKTVRPDVVHAHWLPGFGLAGALARVRPLVVSAWGSDVYRAGRAMRGANRLAVRAAGMVTADSEDLLDRCVALGARRERTRLIQWGVNVDLFQPSPDRAEAKRRLGLTDGPVVLSPRSFMPVYNIPLVIESFQAVGEQIPDAQFILKHMGAVSIELPPVRFPDRTRIIGKVPYETMADYYRAADVCVSLTSSDSSPRSVWEAMASGAPCVLSDLPWVQELIQPERDALTVPIDAGALAEATLRILRDSQLSEKLARNGRALVERHLDRAREIDKLIEVYATLADTRHGHGL